jgi:hypothetical protein
MESIDYPRQLEHMTESLIETGVNRQCFISPTMFRYYKFPFPFSLNNENVFINVQSPNQLCTVISIQSFYYPVYNVSGNNGRREHH